MRCTNHASGLAIPFRRAALLSAALALSVSYCCSTPLAKPRVAWSITTEYSSGPILEDVSRRGLLLLNEIGGYVVPHSWNIANPKLILRTPGAERPIEIPLPDWPKQQYALPDGVERVATAPDLCRGLLGV